MVSGVRWRDALFLVILDRKCTLYRSKWALPWAVLNVALSVSLYLDIRKGSFSQLFEDYASFIWYLELLFAGIFSLCALHRFWQYLWPTVGQSPLEILPVHQRLCAITENDAGFKLKTPRKCEETNAEHQTPSPRHVLIPSMLNYSSTSSSFLSSTPLNCSINSWTSPGVTSGSNLSTSSSSWIYHSGSSPVKHMLSPVSPSKADCNSSYTPRKSSYIANFTSSSEKQIKNEQQLEQYLKDYEEKEQKSILMSSGNSGSISNFWSLQRPASNFISMLRKYQYQPSSRSPQSASTHRDDSPATLTADSVWTKLKVSEEELNLWIEKLRKWLCQTIVAKVINEIDDLNHSLRRIGSPDIQIGEVSQSTLRHIAISKGQNLPTLSAILPYLDVTSNQEYLVYRLKGLALGGSMSEFKWNSGGVYKGKPWTDDLPTDSAIVMHIFCCYMDSRLPPDPHYPDGKTFTSQYFKKNPERPAASKESLCIYQSRVTPPHYRVIIGIDVWDLPKGRNNLFCAILLFLHHVKSKQCGMLGRVNLGPSGVNILCTIDS